MKQSRTTLSNGLAAGGVLLFVSAGVSPESWFPVAQLFVGISLLAVSHVLTPCKDQITHWWRRRISRLNPRA